MTAGDPRPDRSVAPLLDRMLTLDALGWAWRRVRENGGAAGGDEVTLRRFGRLLDANLLALADAVRDGSYRPGRPRSVTIRSGRKTRRLAILPVRDRILQRAALDLLGPLIEPTFLPASFGYRPGLSLHDAVERIVRLRDRGLTWVVDADIRDCFGSLDHVLLVRVLAPHVPDEGLMALVRAWIDAPPRPTAPPRVGHPAVPHRHGPTRPDPGRPAALPPRRPNTKGIPQGAPLSPLLCNVYLDQLDRSLARRRLHLVRYADDFVVLGRSEAHAAHALRTVEKVLAGLELELHPGKTRLTSFEEGFTFLGVDFVGDDYAYVSDGKRIVVDRLPPEWFHYHAEADY